MTFIHYQKDYNKKTLGQNWTNQTLDEKIDLCQYQYVQNYLYKYINKQEKILEAGCGTGSWVFNLNNMGLNVEGIDTSKEAVDIALKYNPMVKISKQDIQKTNYPDNHFDTILCFGVLEHFIEGPQKALLEFKRIIKNNGIIILTIPTQNVIRYLLINHIKRIRNLYYWMLNEKLTFGEYRYSITKFNNILNQNGIKVIETAPEDMKSPKSLGFYIDFPFLRNNKNKYELNNIGKLLEKLLKKISPKTCCAATIFICKVVK